MPDPSTLPGASPSLGLAGDAVTLVEGPAFCISGRSGDIAPNTPQGLFFRDTRFLSRWELRVNDQFPEPLSAERTSPFSATYVLRSRPASGQADTRWRRRRPTTYPSAYPPAAAPMATPPAADAIIVRRLAWR